MAQKITFLIHQCPRGHPPGEKVEKRMGSLNKVMLIGNMGRDPEVRTTPSGAKVANFSIATSESYTDRNGQKVDKTEWHNIVLWRGLAEIAEKYLRKGGQVYIEGRLQTRSWDDQNGQKRYTTEVVGDNMVLLGRPGGGQGSGGRGDSAQDEGGQPAFSSPPAQRNFRNSGGNGGGYSGGSSGSGGGNSNLPPIAEDDLPF